MGISSTEVDFATNRGDLTDEEEAAYLDALQFIREEAMENPSGRGPMLYYASDQDADTRGSVSLIRAYAEEIDAEVRALIDEQYARATQIITEHRDKLDAVAIALLERETLDADEFSLLMDGQELPPLILPKTLAPPTAVSQKQQERKKNNSSSLNPAPA